jgi:peptidoglycan-associated lipoprotein
MLSRYTLLISMVITIGAGCSKQAQQPEPKLIPAAAPLAEPRIIRVPEKVNIYIDRKIVELCFLPVPHFAFDSSDLSGQTRETLKALAECFSTGPASGRSLKLIGHADPRGTDEYNMALGERRAATVAAYLKERGVVEGRMQISSRGELDATGTDEASYADDRQVGLFLAD